MQPQAATRAARLDASLEFRTLIRIVLSSPIIALILLLAVSAAAEEPGEVPERAELEATQVLLVAPPAEPAARMRLFGFDVFAMTGSLVDDRAHSRSGYALPWGRGPLELGERVLGLAWGWRF